MRCVTLVQIIHFGAKWWFIGKFNLPDFLGVISSDINGKPLSLNQYE